MNKRWSLSLFAATIFIIYATCLPSGSIEREANFIPFVDLQHISTDNIKLYFRTLFVKMHILNRVIPSSILVIMFANVLLFIPFGFFLSGFLSSLNLRAKYPIVLVVGFLFSLSIETFQLFISTRTTDIDDLILNTTGLILGATLFYIFNNFYFPADREQNNSTIE